MNDDIAKKLVLEFLADDQWRSFDDIRIDTQIPVDQLERVVQLLALDRKVESVVNGEYRITSGAFIDIMPDANETDD